LANRAKYPVLLGFALLCAAALPCSYITLIEANANEGAAAQPAASTPAGPASTAPVAAAPVTAPEFPIASDARLAGDTRQTRFVLDLDKPIQFRAFALADPYRVVVDIPQVNFQLPAGTGAAGRGLIKAFRYGLVMPGGSRLVFDLNGPAKIANSYVLPAGNGQPPRLVLEFEQSDRTTFVQSLAPANRPELRPAIADAKAEAVPAPLPVETKVDPGVDAKVDPKAEPNAEIVKASPPDPRPLIVIDPGHGGLDNGTQADGQAEKDLVLSFGLALRDRIEKSGKYRVVMTRTDDTFIPLDDRVKIAQRQAAALFVSIHADYLPHREGDVQGATIYTVSDKASDAEAGRLADAENKADAIGGVNLTEEPTDVADILIDLAQRETRNFSNRFARLLAGEMKNATRMYKHPLKSAGFRVLKAPDVPSVLVELGYVSNKSDLEHLVSDSWRTKTVGSMAQAIDAFFAKRLATAGAANRPAN
jgi:N-acetylmuramoyl-L-alanine amidase